MEWYENALCKGMHSDMWYPPLFKEERIAPENHYYELGKFVCEHCPVIDRCFDEGKEEEYGMWGGRTPKDRRLGRLQFNKTYLPVEHLDKMPKHTDASLDASYFRISLRKWLKRRPRSR